MNINSIMVLAIVVIITASVAVKVLFKKGKGGFGCSRSCSGCPMSGSCHKSKAGDVSSHDDGRM